jgi:hypothetical protein
MWNLRKAAIFMAAMPTFSCRTCATPFYAAESLVIGPKLAK